MNTGLLGILTPILFFAVGTSALALSQRADGAVKGLTAAGGVLSIVASLALLVRMILPVEVSDGATFFLVTSWTFVLGTMVWSFAKILKAQASRNATPDPDDDMTAYERVPPTA